MAGADPVVLYSNDSELQFNGRMFVSQNAGNFQNPLARRTGQVVRIYHNHM